MPWSNNSGGPWGGGGGDGQGGGRGPWGGGGGGDKRPPDIDDILRQGRERLRVIVGGGTGGRGGGGGLPPIKPRTALIGGGIVLFAGWVFASLYTLAPEEQSVELLFGEYIDTGQPGLNFAPWPVVTYEKRAVTRENTIDVGYTPAGRTTSGRDEGLMLTSDENIVDIDFQVVWNINDLRAHLFNLAGQAETIRAVSESSMRDVISRSQLSPILNRDRALISQQVRDLIQSTLDSYQAGVNVLRVNFDRADPPQQVIDAFRDVQAASQDRDTAEKRAEAYANQALAEARGRAAQILQEAEGYRAQAVNEAAGEAQRFKSILGEYQLAPDVTRTRLYLETMERVLGDIDKVIIDQPEGGGGQGVVPYLPLNELRRSGQ
ncbi:MAG: FtsH protease activity modulator HflK [Rubrimonas sp.]|uniref:FtsH protease activity modulator HflK n=1 Tax=Rubrimonas sp. TaxID=2036015 RepID=UPI002FDEF25D